MHLDDFRWNDESTVIRHSEAVAVYINQENDLVIRQEDSYGEPDRVIIIPMDRLHDVLVRMHELTDQIFARGCEDTPDRCEEPRDQCPLSVSPLEQSE